MCSTYGAYTGFFAPAGMKILHGFVVVTVRALVERTLNAVVSLGLTYFKGITKDVDGCTSRSASYGRRA
jgi:hypothetical protein